MRATIILFVMLILASCCQEIECRPAFVDIGIINFTQSEADTFIIRRLLPNTNRVKDTLLVSQNGNAEYFAQGPDSARITLFHYSNPFVISAGHDYQIYFPATGTIAQITEINQTPSTQTRCAYTNEMECYNGFVSLKLNGITQTLHRAYIRK